MSQPRPPATRFRPIRALMLPAAVLLATGLLDSVAAGAPPSQLDSWQVRATGSGEHRRVESSSDLNAGKPERTTPLAALEIARRASGRAEVRLHAEPAIAQALATDVIYSRELDKAVDWLSRLPPPRPPAARIEVARGAPPRGRPPPGSS